MRSALALTLSIGVAMGFPGTTDTATLVASDFASSDLAPFRACNYKAPSYVAPEDGHLSVYFDETEYDGSRNDRGVEICADNDPVLKELWHGFNLFVPQSYPDDKQSIIAQQFCLGYCSSWCSTLSIEKNALVVNRRSTCGTSDIITIVDNISRDTWHPIVVNARFSNANDGRYIVYYDTEEVYSVENINLGFDDAWTDDGTMTTGVGFKNGQYNADTAVWNNGTRTLLFDNVSWYNVDAGQTDGYEVVAP